MILKQQDIGISFNTSGQRYSLTNTSVLMSFIQYVFHDTAGQGASPTEEDLANLLDLNDFKRLNPHIKKVADLKTVFAEFEKKVVELGEMKLSEINKIVALALPEVDKTEIFSMKTRGGKASIKSKGKKTVAEKITVEGEKKEIDEEETEEVEEFNIEILGIGSLKLNELSSKRNYIIEQGTFSKDGIAYREGQEDSMQALKDDIIKDIEKKDEKGQTITDDEGNAQYETIDNQMSYTQFSKLIDLQLGNVNMGGFDDITFNDEELKKWHFKRLGIRDVKTVTRTGRFKARVEDKVWASPLHEREDIDETNNSEFFNFYTKYYTDKITNRLPLLMTELNKSTFISGDNIKFRNTLYQIEKVITDNKTRGGPYLVLVLNDDVLSLNKKGEIGTQLKTVDNKPITPTFVKFSLDKLMENIKEIDFLHQPTRNYSYRIKNNETKVDIRLVKEYQFTKDTSGRPSNPTVQDRDRYKRPHTTPVFTTGEVSGYFTEGVFTSPMSRNSYKDKGEHFFMTVSNHYNELKAAIVQSNKKLGGN